MKEKGSFVFLSAHLNVFPEQEESVLRCRLSCSGIPTHVDSVWRFKKLKCCKLALREGPALACSGRLACGWDRDRDDSSGKQQSRLAGTGKLQPGLGPFLDLLLLLVREVSAQGQLQRAGRCHGLCLRGAWGARLASARASACHSALDKGCC